MRPVLSLMELCSKLHYLPEKLLQTGGSPLSKRKNCGWESLLCVFWKNRRIPKGKPLDKVEEIKMKPKKIEDF